MVDPDHTRFKARRNTMREAEVPGEKVCGQAIRQPIGLVDKFVQLAPWVDNGNRAERLLAHYSGVRWNVRQHRRLEEESAPGQSLAAAGQRRAASQRILDQGRHLVHAPAMRQRPHIHTRLQPAANAQGAHAEREVIQKRFK